MVFLYSFFRNISVFIDLKVLSCILEDYLNNLWKKNIVFFDIWLLIKKVGFLMIILLFV